MPLDAGFLSMLTQSATWEAQTVEDKWGNEGYKPAKVIKCFITEQETSWGTQDGQDKQERKIITSTTMITDALGIIMGDKITAYGKTLYVIGVDTPKDEVGLDLMHTLTLSTEKEG